MFNNLEVALICAWLDGDEEAAIAIATMLQPLVIYRLPARYILSLDSSTDEEILKELAIVLSVKSKAELNRHPQVR
ncbi:hypothetical protein F9L16_23345 [Agarivorans sp. B2Z047]|uniref:hypothetical protein n=1 Tax=Agarivorans sp. B2Z047 TaxID=2652721 RepID=UPI00128D8E6D|nr:hypothetical protein [Agarivorans sp. B2Z047]MPW31895.1 hypothetical protein [Agarivorans sp. B2Z047]UQN40977.1 hypothetical protein LQZ07_14470 [Agarivorans sp. B2Z047]